MWYDCQWDNTLQETKMTQKLTTIGNCMAFTNEQSPYQIVSYKRPWKDNVKQFKWDNRCSCQFFLPFCSKGDGGEDTIKSERELAMGWALNTFLRNVGVNRHNSSMDRVQSFIAKDKRLLKIGQQKKKVNKIWMKDKICLYNVVNIAE